MVLDKVVTLTGVFASAAESQSVFLDGESAGEFARALVSEALPSGCAPEEAALEIVGRPIGPTSSLDMNPHPPLRGAAVGKRASSWCSTSVSMNTVFAPPRSRGQCSTLRPERASS